MKLGVMLLSQKQQKDHSSLGFMSTMSLVACLLQHHQHLNSTLCASAGSANAKLGSEDLKNNKKKGGVRKRKRSRESKNQEPCINVILEIGSICIFLPVITAGETNLKFHDCLY